MKLADFGLAVEAMDHKHYYGELAIWMVIQQLYNILNEDISVYSGTPLFQPPEMRISLYTVELLYSNTLK